MASDYLKDLEGPKVLGYPLAGDFPKASDYRKAEDCQKGLDCLMVEDFLMESVNCLGFRRFHPRHCSYRYRQQHHYFPDHFRTESPYFVPLD